jgi:hypothetical protein
MSEVGYKSRVRLSVLSRGRRGPKSNVSAIRQSQYSPIGYRNFLANLPLTMSFEAILNSDGHRRNAHISNARHLVIPKVPDFWCGRFLISVDQHQSS